MAREGFDLTEVRAFGGIELERAVTRLLGDPASDWVRPQGWSVEAWLLAERSVGVVCAGSGGDPAGHRVTLRVDGTVAVHDHSWRDLATELMLAGLSGSVPACLMAWSLIERGCLPSGVDHAAGTTGWEPEKQVQRWRVFAAARAWARVAGEPGWWPSDAERAALIGTGTSPQAWAPWATAGVSPVQAKQFLLAGVSPEAALPWIEQGLGTAKAAAAAKAGERPDFDAKAWSRAGFTKAQARSWYGRLRCSPEEAAVFKRAGGTLDEIESARRRAPLGEVADWMRAGFSLSSAATWLHLTVPRETAAAWEQVGVSSLDASNYVNMLYPWWRKQTGRRLTPTQGRDLLKQVDATRFSRWLTLCARDNVGACSATMQGLDPQVVADWGGKPATPWEDRWPLTARFAAWWPVVAEMDKATWDGWLAHTDGDQWRGGAKSDHRIGEILDLHRRGYSPALFEQVPAEWAHSRFLSNPVPLLLLTAEVFDGNDDAVREFVRAGWLADALLGEKELGSDGLALRIARLRRLFAQDRMMSVEQALVRLPKIR